MSLVDLRPALLICSIISLLSLLVGAALFPRAKVGFLIPLPTDDEVSNDPPAIIAGEEFRVSPYKKSVACMLKLSGFHKLLPISALSVACPYWLLTGHYSSAELLSPGAGMYRVETIGFTGFFVLFQSLAWLQECWILRRANIAVGYVIGTQWGNVRETATYNFFDDKGERRGGRCPLVSSRIDGSSDDCLVVFYDRTDPDENVASPALRFHKLQTVLVSTPEPMPQESEQL
jgi:hypothetical protein